MSAIVDVQGFKTETNEFIPKEIAVLINNKIQVLLIKPPFPFYNLTKQEKRQVTWIERNRKIYWNEGVVSYSNYQNVFMDIIRDKRIFTKGVEKVLWLKNIVKNNNVYNFEDRGCPSLLSLNEEYENYNELYSCIYHDKICALKIVFILKKWCIDNKIII